MNRYNESRRVVCPHCQGDKTVLSLDRESDTPFETCPICLGEGIVIKTLTYKPLTHEVQKQEAARQA